MERPPSVPLCQAPRRMRSTSTPSPDRVAFVAERPVASRAFAGATTMGRWTGELVGCARSPADRCRPARRRRAGLDVSPTPRPTVVSGHLGPARWAHRVRRAAGAHALVRELREELGIVVDPAGLESSITLTPEPGLTIHVWVVRSWSGEVSNLAPAEHDALGWFTPVGVAELELPNRVLVDLSREALASTPADERRDRSGRV